MYAIFFCYYYKTLFLASVRQSALSFWSFPSGQKTLCSACSHVDRVKNFCSLVSQKAEDETLQVKSGTIDKGVFVKIAFEICKQYFSRREFAAEFESVRVLS